MSMIQQKAQWIATAAVPDDGSIKFDPAIILVIVQAITRIIKAIQECRKQNPAPPQSVSDLAKRPGVTGRWHVRRAIRLAMDDEEMSGLIGPRLVSAVFAEGAKTTEEESAAMLAEVS